MRDWRHRPEPSRGLLQDQLSEFGGVAADRKYHPSREGSGPRLSNNRDFSIELAKAFASEMSVPSGNHRNTVLASTWRTNGAASGSYCAEHARLAFHKVSTGYLPPALFLRLW